MALWSPACSAVLEATACSCGVQVLGSSVAMHVNCLGKLLLDCVIFCSVAGMLHMYIV